MSASSLPRMTESEFRMFAELLRTHCGLHFAEESRYLLEQRVRRRMDELALPTYAAYHFELRDDTGPELGLLIDEVTTNETYFLREKRQLRALIDEIVPEVMAERRGNASGPVSIWSAGCASGEEPYSIAIMALEAGIDPERDLRIYASDISKRMLRQARQGAYRKASFRGMDDRLRSRYFEERDGRWKISDDVRKCVNFVHLNLLEEERFALLRPMDVVLCRNVIIYFDRETKVRVIRAFEDKLRPGGHLLLGHSESLIRLSSGLELRHLERDMVYRKPVPGIATGADWDRAARQAIADVETPR